MAILDAIKEKVGKAPVEVPPEIEDRLRRGRVAMLKDHALRRCCQKFWEGEHYWYVNSKNGLSVLPSAVVAVEAGKPLHRVRNTYNFAGSIIEGKVSASTQKVPGYEITPSTDDYEDEAAATLSAQVAAYGYDKWRLRRKTTKAFTNAFVQREGFAMPYWDANVGPFTWDEETKKYKGKGEVKILNLSRSEVMWEPGVDFDDSRWHAIERAQTPEDVKNLPGYVGGALTADALTSDIPEGKRSDTMIRTTQYMERPSTKYPEGRCCWIANTRIIVDYRKADELAEHWYEPHPCLDADGEITDEPALHRISYTVNAEGDDMGLMERLIDLSRTIDDCWNKILEWKNRCLIPQWQSPNGSNSEPRNDIPGYNYKYNLVGGKAPEQLPVMPIPRELLDILSLALEHMRALAADIDVQPDPRLTTGTANAAIQSNQSRWQSFLGDAAEFHSRLMRHCLSIVAREYDEPRQIDIRGQYGWQPIPAFTGQAMRSQVNVRVNPGSLESKSRQAIQQEIEFIQANWPGAITAEAALSTLHGGSAEGLLRSYQNDVAKAWRIVKRLQQGEAGMASFGTHHDPNVLNLTTGQMGDDIPNWMPCDWDSIPIWRQIFGDYMKTEHFEGLGEHIQANFRLVWDGLEQTEQARAAKQAAQQQMQAESLGMGNAAAPQSPPPLPDRAGFNPDTNQSPVPTP